MRHRAGLFTNSDRMIAQFALRSRPGHVSDAGRGRSLYMQGGHAGPEEAIRQLHTQRYPIGLGPPARCMGPTQVCAAQNAAQQKTSLGRINPLKADRERLRSRAEKRGGRGGGGRMATSVTTSVCGDTAATQGELAVSRAAAEQNSSADRSGRVKMAEQSAITQPSSRVSRPAGLPGFCRLEQGLSLASRGGGCDVCRPGGCPGYSGPFSERGLPAAGIPGLYRRYSAFVGRGHSRGRRV